MTAQDYISIIFIVAFGVSLLAPLFTRQDDLTSTSTGE